MPTPLPTLPACHAYDHSIPNAYGYLPSLAAGIVFLTLFFLSSVTHVLQFFRYRRWWLLLFALGAGVELLGWIGRTGSSQCSYSRSFFVLQISLLIIAPAFTSAGLYVILYTMIPILGRHTSPIAPKKLLYVCLAVDIISIVAQGVGGGMAGAAFSNNQDTTHGTYTMVGGILFQLVSLAAYSILVSIVFFRGWKRLTASKPLLTLGTVLIISICCLVIRGIFRAVELLEGWTGYLNTHQTYLLVLDATMMIISLAVFNVYNPGRLLRQANEEHGMEEEHHGGIQTSQIEVSSTEEVKRSV